MQTRHRDLFTTVTTEGAILPVDLLQRIAHGDRDIEGLRPEDYHLSGEKISEATSRSWNRLLGAWQAFQAAAAKLPETDTGTTAARERWLLPLFQELGYGRLITVPAAEIDGKAYPISHGWQHAPIHLVGFRVDISDRTQGVKGASRASPHSLVQEFLNRSKAHLWGFVSNGLRLRILRDNVSLTRQAYVEFDLEAMMRGEVYSDFVLLWLLCHQSRVEAEKPEQCWLEKWSKLAAERGTRALDQLRVGVEQAITALGQGFLSHPANKALREKLKSGELPAQDYYRQLLRLVYRLLFLFVAEDRGLLLDPAASDQVRGRYLRYYSAARLRRLAERRGSKHPDAYRALDLVMCKLEAGCPELGLPALGSFLWSKSAIPALVGCDLANHDLLDAVRALAFTVDGKVLRPVDYKNLGSEELGSVYESLLELHPELNTDAGTFKLETSGGHERKTTGSYYTPTSLITCLLDSALDPVVAEAVKKPEPEQALLALKVCDPACGSGHFLIAAAHRLAKRLAALRTGDPEPAPEPIRTALRDVIGRCIYGVDINPMAVELCKVSLWMEALEPGKPLSFLDHRIQCGNSLLGVTPALLAKGIPDAAFTPIEGDDKKYCSEWKKRNKKEREADQGTLFDAAGAPWEKLGNLAASMANMDGIDDGTLEGVKKRQEMYESVVKSSGYLFGHLLADAWCAAFVWKKTKDESLPYPITEDVFRKIEESPFAVDKWMKDEIQRLARQYQFFHWHLAFPDVFKAVGHGKKAENEQMGWNGGFDVVLGNPPWEHIELKEEEWFAQRRPDIAGAMNAAARKRLIEKLATTEPQLFCEFKAALRQLDGENQLIRLTNRFPLCARGRINTYAIFAEHNLSVLGPLGRAGFIVPSGIATDDTTKDYFEDVVTRRHLVAFYGFENEAKLFKGIDHRVNFSLFLVSRVEISAPEFSAFVRHPELLRESERVYRLTATDIALLNPNSKTCPVFRCRRDADINLAIYRRSGILWRESDEANGNPWGLRFLQGIFNMASDSNLFRTRMELESEGCRLVGNRFIGKLGKFLPLIEAKMVYLFNHRFGDFALLSPGEREHILPQTPDEKLASAEYLTRPRYWVLESEIDARLNRFWSRQWLLGWRDITDARSSVRTVVASLIPRAATGDTFLIAMPQVEPALAACLYASLCCFALDYVARQKVGGTHLKYHIFKQLAVLTPMTYTVDTPWHHEMKIRAWLLPRVLELTFTAWDLELFALDVGFDGPPFRWDPDRRFLIRCELDAAFFHLYGITRDDTAYIMDTFPIVRKNDEKAHGEYRTKRVIMEIYDEMAEATRTGKPYQTRLDPPPADPRCCHSPGSSGECK